MDVTLHFDPDVEFAAIPPSLRGSDSDNPALARLLARFAMRDLRLAPGSVVRVEIARDRTYEFRRGATRPK